MFKSKSINSIILLLLSALVSISIAFFNRYPLVFSDTGAYLLTGFKNILLPDRPSAYGVFITHIGLKSTLWLPIFIQAVIASYLIYLFIECFKFKHAALLTFIIVSILTFTTGYATFCSQVMPDIFTSFCILSIIILLFHHDLSIINRVLLCVIFVFSSITHGSHLLINLVTLILFTVFYFIWRGQNSQVSFSYKSLLLVWLLALSNFLFLPSFHYIVSGEYKYSKGAPFLVGRLAENGILNKFLEDNCKNGGEYRLCEYKDKLPTNAASFVWDPESPFNKNGGWQDTSSEYNKIINATLTQPRYLKLHIRESVKATFQQFFNIRVGDGLVKYGENSSPYNHIIWFLPNEFNAYCLADQQRQLLNFKSFTQRQLMILCFSFLVLGYFFAQPTDSFNKNLKLMGILLLLFIFFNACICGTLSGVFDRYQCRVVWLIPLFAITILLSHPKSFIKWPRN